MTTNPCRTIKQTKKTQKTNKQTNKQTNKPSTPPSCPAPSYRPSYRAHTTRVALTLMLSLPCTIDRLTLARRSLFLSFSLFLFFSFSLSFSLSFFLSFFLLRSPTGPGAPVRPRVVPRCSRDARARQAGSAAVRPPPTLFCTISFSRISQPHTRRFLITLV